MLGYLAAYEVYHRPLPLHRRCDLLIRTLKSLFFLASFRLHAPQAAYIRMLTVLLQEPSGLAANAVRCLTPF